MSELLVAKLVDDPDLQANRLERAMFATDLVVEREHVVAARSRDIQVVHLEAADVRHELPEHEHDLLGSVELGLLEWPELVVRDVEDDVVRPIGGERVHVGGLEAIEAARNDFGVGRHWTSVWIWLCSSVKRPR